MINLHSKKFILLPLLLLAVGCNRISPTSSASKAVVEQVPTLSNTNTAVDPNIKNGNQGSCPDAKEKIPDASTIAIYTSTLGFTLSYPINWVVRSAQKNIVTLNSAQNERVYEEVLCGAEYGEGYMPTATISYYNNIAEEPDNDGNNLGAKSLKEYVYNQGGVISNVRNYTLNGISGYRATVGGFGSYDVIFLERKGHIYEIMFDNASPEVKDKVLKGFKFN